MTYNVVQPMQTVTLDDQGAVLINAAAAGGAQQIQQLQLSGGQTLLTPSVLRGPNVLPNSNIPAGLQTGLLQNLAGQTVQFPGGKMSIPIIYISFKQFQIFSVDECNILYLILKELLQ